MTETTSVVLTPGDWASISSPYLADGRKSESWEIGDIEITGKKLKTVVRMTSTYISATDPGDFHLSFITCLEFLSQIMIIHGHVWANLKEKTREGWMVESFTRNARAIRDPDNIQIEMTVASIRKIGEAIYSVANFQVTDSLGGLLDVRLKAILP